MRFPTPAFLRSPLGRAPTAELSNPIVLTRIDNRLVHGQILSTWVPALRVNALLVLDDEAASNALVRSAMEISIPPDVHFEAVPVAQADAAFRALRPTDRTLVLMRDISEAARAVAAGFPLTRLNLGNVHFSHGRKAISQAVYLSLEELAELEGLAATGVEIELQTLPSDTPVALPEIRRRMLDGSRA